MAVFESISECYLYQLRKCESYVEQCKVHAEPELVHELRLSIKKLRAFNLLAHRLGMSGVDDNQQLIEGVQKLFSRAGQIRDTQVQIYMLASSKEQTGKGYPLFHKWLLRREKRKISQLCGSNYKTSIDSDSGNTITGIANTILIPDKTAVFATAHTLLDEMYVKTQELATGRIFDKNLHQIRKYTKQMRYIINILNGVYPDFKYQRITPEELKDIENAVGNWHDNLIRIKFINRFMKKIKNDDEVIVLKYKGLAEYCLASLTEAYEKSSQLVKTKLLG